MTPFFTALAIILGAGIAAMVTSARGSGRLANIVGPVGIATGCMIGLVEAVRLLAMGTVLRFDAAWSMPLGRLSLGIDPLSAAFLLPTFAFGALHALSGAAKLRETSGRMRLGAHWFFYSLTLAALAMVLAARNAMPFLMAWEVMSVAPFFLFCLEDERPEVRSSAWTYLAAAHFGAALLFILFLLLGQQWGSLQFGPATTASSWFTMTILGLAVAGFGVKAGLPPFHVWLPEVYATAPSHVAALSSAVLLPVGMYGIIRVITFLPLPTGPEGIPLAGTCIVAGLGCALLGIHMAAVQRDLRRLLAYSSMENMGLMLTGIGAGLLGTALEQPRLAAAGFGGALLHMLFHGLFKGLLFQCCVPLRRFAGSTNMDDLGGLMARMPYTGTAFLLGCMGLCGLPPLGGFMSELPVYYAVAFMGAEAPTSQAVWAWIALGGMALTGGIAALTMVKAFGVTFLGLPRRSGIVEAQDPSGPYLLGIGLAAAACALSGFGAPWLLQLLAPAVGQLLPAAQRAAVPQAVDAVAWILRQAGLALVPLVVLAAAIALLRLRLLARRPVGTAVTWDCGYLAPSPRMEYTAGSFSQPVFQTIRRALGFGYELKAPQGYFPRRAEQHTEAADPLLEPLYGHLMDWVERGFESLKVLQSGNVNLYIFYILATLGGLLAWRLF